MGRRTRIYKLRLSRRVGRIRKGVSRGIRTLGRGIGATCRALIPLSGLGLVSYAAYLVHPALGFLTAGLVLLLVDWWIGNR